jgi:hypothetical protein
MASWLAVVLIAAAHQSSAFGPQVERSLELSGISDTFGHKDAFFVLTQPDVWATPRSFILAVGESQYGIKLLAVDANFSHVQIERDGLKQSLRLRSAMDLLPPMVLETAGTPGKPSARDEDGLAGNMGPNNLVDARLAGMPGYGSLPTISSRNPSPVKNTLPGRPSTADSNPQNSNAADPATVLQDQSQDEWYQESANIERNRKETAQAVLAGEMDPWPRTPLTPSGISDKLIGNETFFSDHIPGYRQPLSF